MVAFSERGGDFIPDRAGIGRGRIDAVVLVQKVDGTTRPSHRWIHVGNIEYNEIHRDAANEGYPLAAEAAGTTRTQRAQPTISIADRHGRETSRRIHDMGGTVANRLTLVNFACLKAEDWAKGVRPGGMRVDTVERGSRADKIEVKTAAEENSRRCGKAGWQIAHTGSCGCEASPLNFVQRMLRLIRTSEVTDDGTPANRAPLRQAMCDPVELPHRQPHA